jgi:hypothetical protein
MVRLHARASMLALLLLAAATSASAAQVVVFGDSWATGARTAFVDMFVRTQSLSLSP